MKIRKLIFNVLLELFDTQNIPDDVIREKNRYAFTYQGTRYEVIFQDFSKNKSIALGLNNKQVKSAIKKSKTIFQLDFGIIDENGAFQTDIDTKQFNHIYVLNSVSALVKEFIIENNVDVLVYFAEKQRRNIYKYIYEKWMKNEFYYFEKSKILDNKYESFFIKNTLFN